MPEAYSTSISIACGALLGAAIVIATIRMMPNSQTAKTGVN
jgi:hypothetical protein